MRCGWWGRRRTRDTTPRRHVARKPPGVSHARCNGARRDLVERGDVASCNASRAGFASGNGTLWPPVGPGSRGEAARARHGRRQRCRHPGDREAAPLYLRLQSRRVHLPDHGLYLCGQPGHAPARGRAGGAGDDGATDHRPVRARAWRRDPHGAAQARIQPGGVLRSLAAYRRRGRGAGAGAASLDADRGAGRGPRPARRRGHARRARATTRRARPAVGLTIMLELIAGILLAAGAVYFVLRPIFRPEITGNGDRGAVPSTRLLLPAPCSPLPRAPPTVLARKLTRCSVPNAVAASRRPPDTARAAARPSSTTPITAIRAGRASPLNITITLASVSLGVRESTFQT